MRLGIRARLTVVNLLFLIVIVGGLGAFLVLRLRADLLSTIDRGVRSSAAAIKQNYVDEGPGSFTEFSAATLRRSGAVSQVLGPHGHVLLAYGGDTADDPMVPRSLQLLALRGTPQVFDTKIGDSGQSYRVMATPVRKGRRTTLVVVGDSLLGAEEAVRRILLLLLVAAPVAIAAAGAVGWLVVRNAFAPVDRMRAKAARIGINQLHERLVAPNPEDEIGQLAATLNEMLDRLEAGVLARRQLVADTSHELRTPLAAMRAELDVSLRDRSRSDSERTALASVREEVDRMTRIVEDLLTLARADDGRLPVTTGTVELADVIDSAVAQLQPMADQKGVHVYVDGDDASTEADAHGLHRALANLIENAIEFTPPGGEVTVSSWRNGAEVGVTVSDSGPGIPEASRERVFDRFYRVDPSRSRQSGGSGLGLAICYEIAAAHGGRIWLDSEEDHGSSFSIALPAIAPMRPRPRGAGAAAGSARS
jgi:heavy metal sensor kinase